MQAIQPDFYPFPSNWIECVLLLVFFTYAILPANLGRPCVLLELTPCTSF